MKSSQPGRILLLALLGALVATFCDAIHVHTKTLSYPNPFWFGQAWWVFPLFFVAFALLAVTYHVLVAAPWLKLPREYSASSGEVMPFIEALVVFVLVYVLSGFGNHDPIFLGIFFLVTFGSARSGLLALGRGTPCGRRHPHRGHLASVWAGGLSRARDLWGALVAWWRLPPWSFLIA